MLARFLPFGNRLVLGFAALSPYLTAAGPISIALLALARRWTLTAGAATVTATAIAAQAPFYFADPVPDAGVSLRVMTVNLRLGTAVPQLLVPVAAERADILAVQELTPEELTYLSQAGVDKVFPFRVVDPRMEASGVGLWSRYPIAGTTTIDGFRNPMISTTLKVPDVSTAVTVVVAHISNPWHIDDWKHDIALLPTALRDIDAAARGGPVIVAGDFNSTRDMRPFRDLLGNYRDAAAQAGAGLTPTFPGSMPVPPLFAIDHVLTLRCTAVAASSVTIRGSDHRALAATVRLA